jgi:hypothetical protein
VGNGETENSEAEEDAFMGSEADDTLTVGTKMNSLGSSGFKLVLQSQQSK